MKLKMGPYISKMKADNGILEFIIQYERVGRQKASRLSSFVIWLKAVGLGLWDGYRYSA